MANGALLECLGKNAAGLAGAVRRLGGNGRTIGALGAYKGIEGEIGWIFEAGKPGCFGSIRKVGARYGRCDLRWNKELRRWSGITLCCTIR